MDPRYTDNPEWFEPRAWPKFWRRAFLVTAPVSFPLYGAAFVAYMLLLGAGILVIVPILGVAEWASGLWGDRPQDKRS